MESYNLELYPQRGPVYFGLFRNVTNASDLKQRVIDQDETLGLCLINARMVINKFHILSAVNRAIHDEQTTKIKTHNIYSEIAFNFGHNNNIAKTFTKFGLHENTKNIVVIHIGGGSTEDAQAFIENRVKGDLVEFSQLSKVHDLRAVSEAYDVFDQDDESTLLSLVTGAMALRGH